ncbi:polysaccharide deacetylase family protein [Hymenobacter taeanensis]|uniref:Polysaccharide deacetylase family protein n=1 Tax=Hymenobacter taeanensis TaxID=2735321 RepID=A0A6M6BKS0_9BACT|nr:MULTISPECIES: polysaccharide deacetylase family protein [Hymenobacter]QJX47655.1 polysaccharide deacetylase family protein [Hymenobacter taeanensis]UOQ82863.1 polysaccharide deacetylase family protein [Hymenobacter sp. 5414T-23]
MISKLVHRIKRAVAPRAAVLMYHRIGYSESDAWQLTVNPDFFEQHLQTLKNNYKVLSLDTLIKKHKYNTLPHRSIAITFDDGYIDNYTIALPLLSKYNLPATFFIPTGSINDQKEFWWDELEYIFLNKPQLPQFFTALTISSSQSFDLENETFLSTEIKQRHHVWNGNQPPATRRAALYIMVWKALKEMSHADRENALARIKQWAGLQQPNYRSEYTTGDTRLMLQAADTGLITIGGHTVTHPALSGLSLEEQYAEIALGKSALEQVLSRPVQHFAYPYGDTSPATQAIVSKIGFTSALTTHPSTITASSNPFALSRFQVNNWNASEFSTNIRNWLKYN